MKSRSFNSSSPPFPPLLKNPVRNEHGGRWGSEEDALHVLVSEESNDTVPLVLLRSTCRKLEGFERLECLLARKLGEENDGPGGGLVEEVLLHRKVSALLVGAERQEEKRLKGETHHQRLEVRTRENVRPPSGEVLGKTSIDDAIERDHHERVVGGNGF
jgi:hypothetical protein